MGDIRAQRLNELVDRVAGDVGVLARDVRRELVGGNGIPGELAQLARLVAAGGVGVTDAHIQRLLVIGYKPDELFECIVAAAVGAGIRRLRAIQQLLRDCPP